MTTVVVDIADMRISDNPEETLVTYSLGSCVGVTIYDPVIRIGGMIHCMLPLSKVDKEKAANRPLCSWIPVCKSCSACFMNPACANPELL
jgi:chemotaxis protein CheD